MKKESAVQTGAAADEILQSGCNLPYEICELIAQIMLYVAKMDEDYLQYRRKGS